MKRLLYIVEQLWYQITCPIVALCERLSRYIDEWIEWQSAKCWAKDTHPGWLQYATQSKRKAIRKFYREVILAAYRGLKNEL